MPAPLIGITTHPPTAPDWAELGLFRDWIVRAVERAGGLPVVVPLGLEAQTLRQLFDRLDGLLLSGGGDIDPARYGAQPHASIEGVDAERDEAEIALARWSAEACKPLFGICRGAQLLNVALGGTLYRDMSECPGAQKHTYYPDLPYDLRPHDVQVAPGSRLERILGQSSLAVNSLHHQASRDIAPGLQVSARAPDGVVEALEIPAHPFALAVQWHPECLPDAPDARRLFEAFVRAAG